MAKLTFTEEPFFGRTFHFSKEKTTVGRQSSNDLAIHHDSISHQHSEIHVNGREVIVRDLGSKNGTFVDDIRLKDFQAQLKHGHVVRFGSVKARLDLELDLDDEDSDTAMTAVGLFDKYDAAKEKAGAKPQGDGPEMELGSGDDDPDQTVVMPGTHPSVAKVSIPEEEPSEIPGHKHGSKIIVAVVLIVIIGFLIYVAVNRY